MLSPQHGWDSLANANMRHSKGFKDIGDELRSLETTDMYRHRRLVDTAQGRVLSVDGRELLNFCSNDYLGLAGDARIAEAVAEAARKWGTGSGASHLICGHTSAHHELEVELAEFVGRPRALLYSSGYAANVGVINALLTEGDHVFEDRLNHASLLDGGWISRAAFHWFRHRDYDDLEQQLKACRDSPARKLVVSDGTFSMDGDRCNLPRLVEITQAQDAWLMIDDAHGIGVHGPSGVGSVAPQAYSCEDIAVLIGTLGKAFGTHGAFVAGSEELIETLIQRSRNYIFTTALPSAIAAATSESLKIVKSESWRRKRIVEHVQQFRAGVRDLKFRIMSSCSPIQPLIVGDARTTLDLSRALEERGLLIGAIRPPTVPPETSRLRITLTAAHSSADISRLVDELNAASKEF